MATTIKKIGDQFGLIKSENDEILGLWFRHIKDAQLLSSSNTFLSSLLGKMRRLERGIIKPHFDAIALNAFSVDTNNIEDTESYGGCLVIFKWNKLIARKFPEAFPDNSILELESYDGIGHISLDVLREVTKPRGLSNDKDIDFLKVVCPKCYHFLDNQIISRLIIQGILEFTSDNVVRIGADIEKCCPSCGNTDVVVGIVNLNDSESIRLKSSKKFPRETAAELRDPQLDFISHFDIWDIEEGKEILTGKDKIENLIKLDRKSEFDVFKPKFEPTFNSLDSYRTSVMMGTASTSANKRDEQADVNIKGNKKNEPAGCLLLFLSIFILIFTWLTGQ